MTDASSPAGRLPDVTLKAAGSEREISLRGIGTPALLVFHGQDTADAALEINKAVRRDHPSADEVFIASVIDLRSFPSMFHGMVKPALEKAYYNAAGKVSEGADPADLVVLLPDWDGAVHDAVGVTDSTRDAAVILVDSEAGIIWRGQGEQLAEKAQSALGDLLGS
jgi:hypothetical protein